VRLLTSPMNSQASQSKPSPKPNPKRPLIVDAHVIAYLGDYMIHLNESMKQVILNMTQQNTSQSNTLSSHRKT
jgi:hypothetical protein